MLKLFYAPGTVALATLITLYEVDADFEAIAIDFKQAAQTKPEYLSINPKGRVPALVTERGLLTETPAILVYLAQRYPNAGLLPKDDFDFAQLQSFNSYLASTVHINHAHRMRGTRWATQESSFEDMRSKVPQTMLASFELLQQEYLRGPWVMGEQYTVADAYLFTITSWLESDGVSLAKLPQVAEHFERMQVRAAVQKALELQASI